MSQPVQLHLQESHNGQQWKLFGVEFFDGDDHHTFYMYAMSWEHAEQLVKKLRSAKVYGKMQMVVDRD